MPTATIRRTEPLPAPFLRNFALMHDAMRRDAARLPGAIARASATAGLRRWYDAFRRTIVQHHEMEDRVVWPALVERSPGFATALDELTADHHDLDAALERLGVALRDLGVDAIAAAHDLRDLLDDHLAREEAAAFPRLAECFTPDEYAVVEEQVMRATPMRTIAFELPWILDGIDPAVEAELRAEAPKLLLVLDRLWWRPAYRRIAAVVAA